ncbi:hypothetical protein QFZ70_000376 [Arthrobacter sp. V1I9]|uniref:hypothetical protein n=1 Tax=Arthrobacter sp. V1I9 TaxID=3042275 RepID=UPI00279076D5|nr:hypothetical protein [Arthrobacter sp. V1I9]MDQ0867903.1 hypothetical protein [Arthrobacter sp. V1I9]
MGESGAGATHAAHKDSAQFCTLIESYVESQHEVLRLAAYISSQSAEIDSIKARAWRQIKIGYPRAEQVDFDKIWVEFEKFRAAAESKEQDTTDAIERSAHEMFKLLPDGYGADYISRLVQESVKDPGAPVLFSSLLATLIGEYEVFIGGLLRAALTLHPGALGDSNRSFTWKEITAFDTLQDLREHAIDKAVEKVLRESAEEWPKYIAEKFKIVLPDLTKDAGLLEVFQRRNVIVHNGGRVSSIYLENVPKRNVPIKLGQKLLVDEKYLTEAADKLLAVGLSVAANVGRLLLKNGKGCDHIESTYGDVGYQLLQQERYWVVHQLSKSQNLATYESDYSGLVIKINGWLAQKRLGKLEECRKEIEDWKTSTLAPIFQLAKLALLDDLEAGLKLVRELVASEALPQRHWAQWPLLAEIRQYEKDLSETAELGGQPTS